MNIKVLLTIQAYQKMRHWVNLAKGEVSGLGTVSEVKNQQGKLIHYIIDDIYLLKQESSSADTVLDDSAIATFMIEMAKKKKNLSTIKLWWHSHGNLKTFWSTTDEQCIQNLANSSYMISIVTNKEKQILTRIDIYQPFHVSVNDVPTDMFYPDNGTLSEFCKKEFEQKVNERIFIQSDIRPINPHRMDNDIDAEIERNIRRGMQYQIIRAYGFL
jgi:proteasome lid subunit RPN8/RPN11